MTLFDKKQTCPRSLRICKPTESVNLLIHGQGVVCFEASEPCNLIFSDASGVVGLKVQFTEKEVLATLEPSGEPLIDSHNSKGLVSKQGATYWFSLDSQNLRLLAGVGEARLETMTYVYEFLAQEDKKQKKLFLESLCAVKGESLNFFKLLRDPVTKLVPLLVKNTEELTMDLIAEGNVLPVANLSSTSQKLYTTISGKAFTLNTPDFSHFTDAIEYSIKTPGLWCYETLKKKATEFDKDKPDPSETYLRITLGENNGESPGIPYVMEIWPVGHYSPVHNHGGSSAIIRVLHGSIEVSLFPFLSEDDVLPFANINFKKDDITWISPSLNQVHQLKNKETNKETCITIQCYMYESDDMKHYDYFDYLDGNKKSQQFEPNSDMDFITFKNTMKKEWSERKWCSCW